LFLEVDAAPQLRASRRARRCSSRIRANVRERASHQPGFGDVDRSLFRDSWLVLGKPQRPGSDDYSEERGLLQRVIRISERLAREEQNVQRGVEGNPYVPGPLFLVLGPSLCPRSVPLSLVRPFVLGPSRVQ